MLLSLSWPWRLLFLLGSRMPAVANIEELQSAVKQIGNRIWENVAPSSLRGSKGFPYPPDTRPNQCRRDYAAGVAGLNTTVSIIIPYLRESWEHLEKTMRSILFFTPDYLIKEFILVSDGNPPEYTYEEQLTQLSPKVSLLNNEQRLGLIKSKMKAVERARGEVLVFMEAHCIVNRDWLQPLLVRVSQYPRALVQPTLDLIPQEDFDSYYQGMRGHWRFEWNMNLIFTAPPEPEDFGLAEDDPVPSPATSGGIFAIRRDWWNKLGFYDPQMLEWGGDHVEATMKVWRCGGHIDVHPCSRVGHLFRDPAHRPYDVEVRQVVHNYARLARVWFDDHISHFYKVKPETRLMLVGDVSAQKKLRDDLGCKDMDWYIHFVDPEMEWESSRICIPGASTWLGGCAKGHAAPGRSTIDQAMSTVEYIQRRKEILANFSPDDVEMSHEL